MFSHLVHSFVIKMRHYFFSIPCFFLLVSFTGTPLSQFYENAYDHICADTFVVNYWSIPPSASPYSVFPKPVSSEWLPEMGSGRVASSEGGSVEAIKELAGKHPLQSSPVCVAFSTLVDSVLFADVAMVYRDIDSEKALEWNELWSFNEVFSYRLVFDGKARLKEVSRLLSNVDYCPAGKKQFSRPPIPMTPKVLLCR